MDYPFLSPFQQTVREHEDKFYETFPAAKCSSPDFANVISFVYDQSPSDRGYVPSAPPPLQIQDTSTLTLHYDYGPTTQPPIFMPNAHIRDTALIKNPPEAIHYSPSGILEPHSPLPTPRLEQAYYPTQIYSDAHPPSIARQPESYHVQHPHPRSTLHQYHALSSPIPQSLVQSPVDASFPSPTSYYPPPPDTPSDIGSSPRSEVDDYQAHVQESVVRPAHSLVPVNRAAIKREYLESEEQFPAVTIPITTATASLPPPASAPASAHTIPVASTSNFAVSGPARTSRPRQRDGSHYRYPRSLSQQQQQYGIPTPPASSDLKTGHPMSWVDSHTAMSTAGIPGAGMGTAGASRLANASMRLSPLPSSKRPLEKKPPLACLFCRGRKIACGPPLPGSTDKTCNQCQRRSLACEYPSESRRGMRKKKTDPDAPLDTSGNNEDPLKTTDENAALASVPTSNPAPQIPLPSSF